MNRNASLSRLFLAILVLSLNFSTSARGDNLTWDGASPAVDGTEDDWSNIDNWGGAGTVPGTNPSETATFDNAGNGNTTIDLGAGVTIDQIVIEGNPAAYTLGTGGAGGQTLTFGDNGNVPNFTTPGTSATTQTIDANIVVSGGSNTRFDLDNTNSTLVINGGLSTSGTGTTRIEFGDIDGDADDGNVTLNGDITQSANGGRIDIFVAGADLLFTGTANTGTGGDSNDIRWKIRNNSTVTVSTSGDLGNGNVQLRYGNLNLNSDQTLASGISIGDTSAANGNSAITIGNLNKLSLASNLSYIADNSVANTATVTGGTLELATANRTIIVNNNDNGDLGTASNPELTISSTITNDGSDRDLTIRGNGGGTIKLAPTGTANSFGGVTFQEGTLQLGTGGLASDGDFLTLAARNDAATAQNTVATVDLMGTTHALGDGSGTAGNGGNLTLGGTNTSNITSNGFQANVVSTGGGGALTNVNAIVYNKGTGTGVQRNGASSVSIGSITFDTTGNSKNITIRDGAAATDLTLSSALNTDASEADDDFAFAGDGTLALNGSLGRGGTVGNHDVSIFQNRKTVLGSGTGSNIGGQRTLQISQRNSANFSDFDVDFDVNGENLVLRDGLSLGLDNSADVTTQSNVSIIDSSGGGAITLSGSVDGNRVVKYESGTSGANLQASINPDITWTGTTNFTGTLNVEDGADSADLVLNGNLTAQRSDTLVLRGLQKSNSGTLQINSTGNSNSYTTLTIVAGTVRIAGDGSLGNNDFILGSDTNTGTLDYFGAGETIDNQARIGDGNGNAGRTGGGVILNSGAGTLTFSQGTFNQAVATDASSNRDLAFDGTGTIVVEGTVQDNTGASVSVTKNGSNTLTLNGNNTYSGATSVNAGRVNVTGTNSGLGAFNVANGATAGGEGSVAGTVTIGDGSGAGILAIEANTPGAFSATNNLATGNGVRVLVETPPTAPGAFDVINFGSWTVDLGDFSIDLGGAQASVRGATFAETSGGTGVNGKVTLDLGYGNRTWDGSGTDWEIGALANWVEGDEVFQQGDFTIFSDSGIGQNTVTLQANVAPTTVNFSHTGGTYTIDSNVAETLTAAGGIEVTGAGDVVINSIIAGDSSVSHSGSGTTTLNGTNTYSGKTSVNGGTLLINGDNSGATGAINVASGATLGGSGIIGGATTIEGIHAPGNSPGIQTFAGNLTYDSTPTVQWELADNATWDPGTNFDRIYVGGDLTFNSATTLELDFSQGSVDWNNSFWGLHNIREWQIWGLTGGGSINYTGTASGLSDIGITYASLGNDGSPEAFDPGNNVPSSAHFYLFENANGIYLRYEALPEPTTFGLLGLVLAALTGFARPKRRLAAGGLS